MPIISESKEVIGEAFSSFLEHNLIDAAAALAFYSALAPLVLLFISASSVLRYDTQQLLIIEFDKVTGKQGGQAIEMIIRNASRNSSSGPAAAVFGLVALLFSASAVFAALQYVLNRIFNVAQRPGRPVRGWLRQRLLSIGTLFSLGFLLLVSLIINTALSAVFQAETFLWELAQYGLSIVLPTINNSPA